MNGILYKGKFYQTVEVPYCNCEDCAMVNGNECITTGSACPCDIFSTSDNIIFKEIENPLK